MHTNINRWSVLTASTLINICVGAVYAFSVFALPLTEKFHASMSTIMIAFTINAAISPIPMIIGGKLVDKGGAKKAIIIGGLMFGFGFVFSGLAATPWVLYITYGLLAGIGQGIVYSATIGNTVKLFPDKRGLGTGIVTAGYGGGTIIIAPIANALITTYDVQFALITIGISFLIIIMACSFFFQVCPNNYLPDGWTIPGNKNENKKNRA